MARVRFDADYDYRPLGAPQVTIAFKAGHTYTVKEDCATAVEFLGKGVRVEVPPQPDPMALRFNGADPAKFDHDGKDGPGGSRRGARPRIKSGAGSARSRAAGKA